MTGSLQIKNNNYYMVINIINEEGKRQQKWIGTGLDKRGNKRKAEEILKQVLIELEEKKIVIGKKIKFSDFIQKWLESTRHVIRENTYDNYQIILKAHIIPFFEKNNISLQDLTPQHLQAYYNQKLDSGMSPNSVLKHHANIHKCLDWALQQNLIPYNPSERVNLPKKKRYLYKCIDDEQIKSLIQLFINDPIYSAVYLTTHLGLRRSEVLGLLWDAIDFTNGTISIIRTAVITSSSTLYSDKVKTDTSFRTLPLTNELHLFLLQLKKQQETDKALFGDSYNDNDSVCKWANGNPIKPEYVTHHFKDILVKNNFVPIRFHDLRHSAASLLFELGFNLKEIQEWLGHADINTTSNIYLHLQYKSKVSMAEKLSNRLTQNSNC